MNFEKISKQPKSNDNSDRKRSDKRRTNQRDSARKTKVQGRDFS